MTEAFLHYVWQFQYFDKTDLRTTSGEPVSVFNPGYRNTNAGPDFHQGRIRIADVNWVGNVELHLFSSGWIDHNHDVDPAYDNVILHVVWKDDQSIVRRDSTSLPTVELKDRVSNDLLLQYKKLINNPEEIPCARSFEAVSPITVRAALDKALMQRLEAKSFYILQMLRKNNSDWEETAYQLLSRNFGLKVNADPFEMLGKALPYRVLLKHSDKILQVEALLFGQAGFLAEEGDHYFDTLKREHKLLEAKFSLQSTKQSKAQWKFLRLRPANFPTLRIAQFAALLSERKNIFSRILEASTFDSLCSLFAISPSSYWQCHYHFGKEIKAHKAAMGRMSILNIIINTAVPLLVAYGKAKDEQLYIDRAVEILNHIGAENNAIVRRWKQLGLKAQSSADSQGMIELYNNLCLKRRCLDCNIGFSLLEPKTCQQL